MAINKKFQSKRDTVLRDVRPLSVRVIESARKSDVATIVFVVAAAAVAAEPMATIFADLIVFFAFLYFLWLRATKLVLPFKLPKSANRIDKNNVVPGGGCKMAEGIMYLGNDQESGEEIWFNNSDARTHILYLGTTGSGKTEGLKSISANALCWSSGFLYIDGKADTDLWSTISALARRFGRDDDLLIMNYMTGNIGGRVPSNTMNPFSSGSAGYLVNMLTSLMPDAEGDNAMWKERAVALISALMPCLVWKRENQNLPISVSIIRKYMGLGDIISLSRDSAIPDHLRAGVLGYLNELPGYVDDAFDDEGEEKPLPPDAPPFDSSVPRQQHGYLSMQFTRSLQSLGDDYGFIFDTQAADVDMMDVVLQRRIMITLIPALEKSSDETANLGKIIASTLKGMMGATLGSTVEGSVEVAIENKPARSETPFISIFDEVGYYAAQGMAVMAAQARSLGFCLVYAAQDLPAMEKRIKEEARSITANCNIKLFGKLEDPTQTKEFFEKTVGQAYVTEVSGFARGNQQNQGGSSYADGGQASIQVRARADYDELRAFTEGKAICAFGSNVTEVQIYYSNPGFARATRVHRFLPVPPPSEDVLKNLQEVKGVLQRLRSKKWQPQHMPSSNDDSAEIQALVDGFEITSHNEFSAVEKSALALTKLADMKGYISIKDMDEVDESEEETPDTTAPTEANEAQVEGMLQDSGGPFSWADVIGSNESTETKPDAPTVKVPSSDSDDKEDVDWDELMNDIAEDNKPSENINLSKSDSETDALFDQIFGSESDQKKESLNQILSDDTPKTVDEPLSWANIIGSDKPAFAPINPVEPGPAKADTQKTEPRLTWDDVIGDGSDSDT